MSSLKKKSIKFLDLSVYSGQQKSRFSKTINKVLSSGRFILGKEVEDFEKKFAGYLGSRYCVGVGNGQEAIQIALMTAGVGSGDEVITTPISAAATTMAIMAVGAKPVFVDTTTNGLINAEIIPAVITKKTKAILPVHLYGNSVDLDILQSICKKNNLFLIEDAAQAHGSGYKGKKLGTFGIFGCFSFYPTKNLGAFGDGGAIVTDDRNLAQICRQIRDYGQESKYYHVRFGLNSRLDEIQAAILSVKLDSLDKDNAKRRLIAERYIKNLSKIKDIEIIKPNNFSAPNYHQFVIKVKNREKLRNYLLTHGIETSIHYPLIIPDQPFLKKEYGGMSLPVAREFVKSCLSLPCNPRLSLYDVDYLSNQIVNFCL